MPKARFTKAESSSLSALLARGHTPEAVAKKMQKLEKLLPERRHGPVELWGDKVGVYLAAKIIRANKLARSSPREISSRLKSGDNGPIIDLRSGLIRGDDLSDKSVRNIRHEIDLKRRTDAGLDKSLREAEEKALLQYEKAKPVVACFPYRFATAECPSAYMVVILRKDGAPSIISNLRNVRFEADVRALVASGQLSAEAVELPPDGSVED